MSWKATAYVKEIIVCPNGERITPAEKLLCFVLADYHHTLKDIIWPSQKTLADETLCSERTIRRLTESLVTKGILATEHVGGQGKTVHYRFAQLPILNPDKMSAKEIEEPEIKADIPSTLGGHLPGQIDTCNKEEPVLNGINSKPSATAGADSSKKEVKTVDPRHLAVRETFKNLWVRHARLCLGAGQPEPTTAPWNGRDAGVLDKVLKDNPKWTEKFIVYCLESYFGSEGINGGDPFHTIAPRLTRYCRGPVDRFNRVKATRSVSQDDDSGVNEALRQRSAGRDR